MTDFAIPDSALAHWAILADARFERIKHGLINTTFLATTGDGQKAILQRLHPVFRDSVNDDIQVVTQHLLSAGMQTPTLIPCDNGQLYCRVEQQLWRLLSFVDGRSCNAVTSPKMAWQAGNIVARYHAAMTGLDYTYVGARSTVHDTSAHLQHLQKVLNNNKTHRLYVRVAPLARRILSSAALYARIDRLPSRHAHGDLKISNILFNTRDQAVCLIDLDTVSRMAWPLEMGDALRSWCNPRTEDQLRADLDLDLLEAACGGYAAARPQWLTQRETDALIYGLERICLELSARFLADALTENYFGWDQANYATAGDHNLARGTAMAALFLDVLDKRDAARAIVQREFQ